MDQITFDRIRRRYREDATKLGCGDRYPSILAGQCNEGKVLFLKLSEGYGWRILYFSAADQKIIGGAGISDVRDAECDGMAVWREEIECRDYEITDVICGTFQKVGAKGDLAMPLTRGRKANGIVPKK